MADKFVLVRCVDSNNEFMRAIIGPADIESKFDADGHLIQDEISTQTFLVYDEQLADQIVLACNVHDGLVAALKQFRHGDCFCFGGRDGENHHPYCIQASAALAKARPS